MVNETLDLWRRTAFVWGQTDCILSVCDYIAAITGQDPAKPWRGLYDTEAGAETLASGYGGVLGIMRHGLGLAGLQPLQQPLRGSPVVCNIGGHEIAGLHIGPRSMFRTPRGVIELRAPILGAWAI